MADETILGAAAAEESAGTETAPAGETQEATAAPATEGEAPAAAATNDSDTANGEDSKPDEPAGAPEKYDDFKFPEGVESDAEVMAKASELFKEIGLTQEQAQKLVDFQTNSYTAEVEKTQQAWSDQMDQWSKESKADKEFGGQGLKDNLVKAKAGMDAFGNTEFKDMLEVTGIGNHPEMVRFLVKLGKEVSEHNVLQGNKGGGAPKTASAIMFPDMN